jgi:hypothetical protein
MKFTPKQEQVLCATESAMKHFDAIGTSRYTPLRTMKQLEKLGLVECIGPVQMADGDGFAAVPERWSDGWRLTAKGKRVVKSFG